MKINVLLLSNWSSNIGVFRIIPESIPWLIAKNRIQEAKEILLTAAKRNKVKLPEKYRPGSCNGSSSVYRKSSSDENILKMSRPLATRKRKHERRTMEYTVLDILVSTKLRVYALVMCYIWYVTHSVVFEFLFFFLSSNIINVTIIWLNNTRVYQNSKKAAIIWNVTEPKQ